MNFKSAEKITNKIPYFVKWESGNDMTDPVFQGVDVRYDGTSISHQEVPADARYAYHKPQAIEAGDRTILYLGDDNKLYYPTEATTINPFHAYFKLQKGIKASKSSGDINKDDKVTIADVTSLVNIILGTPTGEAVADVNEDEKVTIADVTALVNVILGKEENTLRTIKTDDSIGIRYGGAGE